MLRLGITLILRAMRDTHTTHHRPASGFHARQPKLARFPDGVGAKAKPILFPYSCARSARRNLGLGLGLISVASITVPRVDLRKGRIESSSLS
ncbi:hypothetical protein RRG08_016696 [Elysia crispata]|uniref:Uncharacterized protein n=1 Tax=Elysia crispata TaxID=231223 RepID=A0AAE1AJ72_9GAST|nr:hypothetical protein RRG08_016696 [Elysia crispata]